MEAATAGDREVLNLQPPVPVWPGSRPARPLRADDSPGRVPPGQTMPVKDRAAQPVAEDERHGGTYRDGGTGQQLGMPFSTGSASPTRSVSTYPARAESF